MADELPGPGSPGRRAGAACSGGGLLLTSSELGPTVGAGDGEVVDLEGDVVEMVDEAPPQPA